MVVAALADQLAPFYILRIWGHCQHRKKDRFEGMPTKGLAALCKFGGDAAALEAALIEARFIERDGADIVVLDWAEKNASLIAAWENGAKGGRPPKKEPNENPQVSKQKPSGNPDQTETKPIEIESKNSSSLRSEESSRAVRSVSILDLQADGLTQQTAEEWLVHRQRKRARLTPRAWEGIKAEAVKAGMSNEAAVCKAMSRGWTGFEAQWVLSERQSHGPPQGRHAGFAAKDYREGVAEDGSLV